MKQFTPKGISLLRTLLFIVIIFSPFAFSFSKGTGKMKPVIPIEVINTKSLNAVSSVALLYENLHLNEMGLNQQAFDYAVKGYEQLKAGNKLKNDDVLTIVDFTSPSTVKRLFVLDVENGTLLFNTYVAHGQGTGKTYAEYFSNTPESHQSSLGFYITTSTYNGGNGFSLKLNGIENGINNLAESRAVVMHGADYVSEGFIKRHGYLGRSYGCPAVPQALTKPIINEIKGGTCLFIYSNNKEYIKRSKLLNT